MGKIINSGILAAALLALVSCGGDRQPATYCNPIDIDYTYMIYNSDRNLSYRSNCGSDILCRLRCTLRVLSFRLACLI